MEYSNDLVKDIRMLSSDSTLHFGITPSDNVQPEALKQYREDLTYNAEYILNALIQMKNLNGSLEGVRIHIPKKPFPLLIDNKMQSYLIAPIARINLAD